MKKGETAFRIELNSQQSQVASRARVASTHVQNPVKMSLDLYDIAMQAYFSLYGLTMTTDPDMFWSAKGIMRVPYVTSFGGATSAVGFFARMTGLGFVIMVLGRRAGTPKATFAKQALAFHVLSTKWFCDLTQVVSTRRSPSIFIPWAWKLQVFVNIILALWGIVALGGPKKALKLD